MRSRSADRAELLQVEILAVPLVAAFALGGAGAQDLPLALLIAALGGIGLALTHLIARLVGA